MLGFASQTWNGWDYMPHAFPRWLDAPDGVMLVGVLDGAVVAIVRIAMPAAGEAWLEGIRVDPRVRGMDVATDLQVAELAWAEANGARIVRYATSARNKGSHRLGARGGFERIVIFRSTAWQPSESGSDGHAESGFLADVQAEAQSRRSALLERLASDDAVATVEDADRLWRVVSEDQTFNAATRLYEPRPWALEELTAGKFGDHVRAGEVLTHATDAGGEAVAVLVADVPPAEEATPRLAVLSGAPRAAFELLERVRQLADEPIRIRYPDGAPLVEDVRELYEQAGYEFSDWELYIFARPLDNAHPVPAVDPAAVILEDEPQPMIKPVR